jgi:hypothetical protein
MIYNATISRIDTPQGTTPGGDPTFVIGSAIAMRCCQSDPTFGQRQTIAQLSLDATDVLFVEMSSLPAIVAGTRVTVQLDGSPGPLQYLVRRAKPSVMAGALSHWELFIRQA